jgi:uncharacterized protein YprB with RNaseH-like and TPR domain
MKLDRERLDRVLRPHQARRERVLTSPLAPETSPLLPAAEPSVEHLVGGQVVPTPHGDCLITERRYPLDVQRGDVCLGDLLRPPGRAAAWLNPQPGLEQFDFTNAAFIDAETTGLSGGVGTLAFLVGIGQFEDDGFVVRQFFMRRPDEEQALLHALAEVLAGNRALVTFNGRAFDLPLLSTRFRLAWRSLPLADAPHFDVLTAARRVWRRRLDSCALVSLERDILRFSRTEEDVPSWLIPTLYQQYLQEGTVEPMARVFYHNREDILSMTALAATLCWGCVAFESAGFLAPVDYVSVGQVLEDAGDWARAEGAYRQALARPLPDEARRTTLARLGSLLKRQERREEAAALWEEWVTSVPGDDVTPFVELAKHHEWHTHDVEAALMWSRWARRIAEGWPPGPERDLTLSELDHRITRLLHKRDPRR